ncbi:MAG: cellulase family glycosylhydrolase [Lachnospiraceae bacterium]|nr:cellulase family glycosylhydrolase [Lachnospiraceae bacterium]
MKRSIYLSLKKALAFCLVTALLAGTFHIPGRADELMFPSPEPHFENDIPGNDDLGDDLHNDENTSPNENLDNQLCDNPLCDDPLCEDPECGEEIFAGIMASGITMSSDILMPLSGSLGCQQLFSGSQMADPGWGGYAPAVAFAPGGFQGWFGPHGTALNEIKDMLVPGSSIEVTFTGKAPDLRIGIDSSLDNASVINPNHTDNDIATFTYAQINGAIPIADIGAIVVFASGGDLTVTRVTLIDPDCDGCNICSSNGGQGPETFKASLGGNLQPGFSGGLSEWPGNLGEVEFELGKEATFAFSFTAPARFNNYARLLTNVPIARADTLRTTITSITVDGVDVPLIEAPTVNGEGLNDNHVGITLFNEWGPTVVDAVDVDDFRATSINDIEIKFIVHEPAIPDETEAYLIFADGGWDNGWWGPGDPTNSANVNATTDTVDGFGTYTTSLDFTTPVNGIVMLALEITDGELLYPNNFMTIDEVKINGTAVTVEPTYTVSQNDDSRTNLHNTTVNALPSSFRTADGNDGGVTWLAIEEPAAAISSIEVTFTLRQGYVIGQGPPAYQAYPDLSHLITLPGVLPVTRIDYEFLITRVDDDVNVPFAARFGNWVTRDTTVALTPADENTTKDFAITFTGAGASDFISLGDVGDNTRGVIMEMTKMTVRSGGVDYDFTFDGSPYDARIIRATDLGGPHNIANGYRNEAAGTVLFVDDGNEVCFVIQTGGNAGKQINLYAVAALESPLPVNIKELIYNFDITGIGSETELTFKAQTARGSWYSRTMDLTAAAGGEISIDMSPSVDTVALLDMGYITQHLPASNIELNLTSVSVNGTILDASTLSVPVIKPKSGENALPNIWTSDGIIASTSSYGIHTATGGSVGGAALVKEPAEQRIYFYIRGGDNTFVPVTVTSVMTSPRSHDYTTAMGVGWNLGNSLDAPGGTNLATWETDWGNPVITRALINEVKAKGYDHIRIPFTVGTGNRFTDRGAATPADELRYVINPTWLNRYKEVVQWAVDAGLYVMVNIHHDSWMWLGREDGWNGDLTDWRYRRFNDHWKELSALFAGMPDTVMFESINEPEYSSIGLDAMLKNDLINSAMVDIVRSTPGNEDRIIVLPTYITNHSERNSLSLMTHIAELEDENIIATVHYYSEWVFSQDLGIRLFDEDCFPDRPGFTPRASIDDLFGIIDDCFTTFGIGTNIGEWGILTYDRQFEWSQQGEELKYYEYFHHKAKSTGTSVSLWDNGAFIDRRSASFEWRKPIIGALLSSSAQGVRSATAQGLDTLYFEDVPIVNADIPLFLNGRTFTGITGLTEGVDYTYSSGNIRLTQAYLSAKYNARANSSAFGIFDTLNITFDDGEVWRQYLVANATPGYQDAAGTRSNGIRIPFDFRGETVRRVWARDSQDRPVGGNNSSWWPYLELGRSQLTSADGAFHVAFPTADSTGSFSLTRGFFTDNNAVGDITVSIEFFSGRIVPISMNIAGTSSSSPVTAIGYDPLTIPPLPDDDLTGVIVNGDYIIEKVEEAELLGNDEITLTLTELGEDGQGGTDSGGTVISKGTLATLKSDHPGMTINIDLENGITFSLDTDTITDDAVDLDFAGIINLIHNDTKVYNNETQGVIVPKNSILITPATTGNFGLALAITVSQAELFAMFIDAHNAKVFYISRTGATSEIPFVINADDSITFTITSASRYVITEALKLEPFGLPPKEESKTTPSGGSGQAVSQAVTTASTVLAPKAPAKTVYAVTANFLNERTGPGTSFPAVGRLRLGTILEIKEISADGRWALAHTGTWVSLQYLNHISGPATPEGDQEDTGLMASKYSVLINPSSRLFVRNAPGMQGRVVGTLRRGDIVNVTSVRGGWATIAYTREMPVAYVSLQFLRPLQ